MNSGNVANVANITATVYPYGIDANNANVSYTTELSAQEGGVQAIINVPDCFVGNSNTGYQLNVVSFIECGAGYINEPNIVFTSTLGGDSAGDMLPVVRHAAENGKFGGHMFCRYVTHKVSLADGFDSGDLRVYVTGIKPIGTQILAFYKVKSSSDPDNFSEKSWVQMEAFKNLTSPDQYTAIDLEFRPNLMTNQLSYIENGVTYPLGGTFNEFAIKLVLMAQDPAVPPRCLNMRAVSVPAG
jgi:hypothetical protein